MNTTEIVSMSKKCAKRYKAPNEFEDLVSEGVLAALEKIQSNPNFSKASLWQTINWAQWKYLNVSLQDVKIPENLVRIAKNLGTPGVETNYTKESIEWVRLLLSKGNSDYTQEDLASQGDGHLDQERKESLDYMWSTASECLTGAEFSLLHSYYCLGSKQKDLAEGLDLTDRALRYRMEAIIQKVKGNLDLMS